jgi:hypothetical protein
MSEELKPLTTSDTTFATYLKYHNHQVVGIIPDKNDVKRKVFVFAAREDSEELRRDFYEGSPTVDPRFFERCGKDLRKMLRGER